MAGQAPCVATLQSCCAMPSWCPPQKFQHQLTCWRLALSCSNKAAFSTGQVPWSWKTPLVTPAFKKEDVIDTVNCRPTSVGQPISRPCASIMVQCLVKYTELQQLRFSTQTGYGLELGTIHPAFGLQHVIDKHRHANQPLYLCFVDSNQRKTRSSGISSGACCNAWECMATFWVLSSPCMIALCYQCGLVVSVAPARVHPLASDRPARSGTPSSAPSLTVCTNICKPLFQLLECK